MAEDVVFELHSDAMNIRTFTHIRFLTLVGVFCFDVLVVAERMFVANSRTLLGTQSNRTASVRLGDLDGDDDLDIAVANGRHWPQQNFVFFNQGRARFTR